MTAVAIVGLGLVGGSLARALTRAGDEVLGVDRPSVVAAARRARAIREGVPLSEAARAAELIVLAAPPEANLRLLRRLAAAGRDGPVITDVGSVKLPIFRAAERLGLSRFVGGHPMAGTEGRGFAASRADLFQGRTWILTPTRSRAAAALVRRMAEQVGARRLTVPPAEHDRAMAFLSHLPQVVSWAILAAAREDPVARRYLRAAGPGFRSMTRLAASPPGLWREILGQNRAEVRRALRTFVRALRRP